MQPSSKKPSVRSESDSHPALSPLADINKGVIPAQFFHVPLCPASHLPISHTLYLPRDFILNLHYLSSMECTWVKNTKPSFSDLHVSFLFSFASIFYVFNGLNICLSDEISLTFPFISLLICQFSVKNGPEAELQHFESIF